MRGDTSATISSGDPGDTPRHPFPCQPRHQRGQWDPPQLLTADLNTQESLGLQRNTFK